MHCHGESDTCAPDGRPVILIGNPNVGKSAIFGALTGRYVEVSNYPGTTVELSRGKILLGGNETALIDTPGVASLLPRSDDERVARDVLLAPGRESPWAVIQVADAKNLRRALMLTFQLAEHELPFVLDLNMADEAEQLGIRVDIDRLSQTLGADVVRTVATRREGVDELRARLLSPRPINYRIRYDGAIEDAVARMCELLPEGTKGKRAMALALLAGEHGFVECNGSASVVQAIVAETAAKYREPLGYVIARQRLKCADCIMAEVWSAPKQRRARWAEKLGRLAVHPLWGWPILALVLAGMYEFVGAFGAGMLVGWMENVLFGEYVHPIAVRLAAFILFAFVRDFLVGPYGLITMALSYGIAIVLPIVFTFFLGNCSGGGSKPRPTAAKSPFGDWNLADREAGRLRCCCPRLQSPGNGG